MESTSSNDEVVPNIGMAFSFVKDYETFHTNYAKRVGFSWNIRITKWDQNRQITYQILVCSRAGYRRSKIDPLKKTNPTFEQNCKAGIIVKRDKKIEYVLIFVNIQHNHTISPSMAKTLRKSRELSLHAKRIAEINDQVGLYKERDRWVFIFLSNSFWAGMSSTQRSETQQEYELDAASFNTIIPCATASAIEKQFQKEYTHAKFNELQKEFRAKANCFSTKEHEEGYVVTYKVIEELENGDKMFDVTYKASFDSSTSDSNGILCRHSLSVLGLERVKKLLNKYILDRWKKTLKRKHSNIKCSHDQSKSFRARKKTL
ncbi:hypothetical protein Ahy_B03g066928 isoform A [Arachis hypogaea]|uniref:Protein FAR1-RELATED SEQUENCE n=1 Tax=Arachis hypogaea TaxID=3818 RepID=A0A445A588_ARAHY|nr:hypothetical protein Ahy_B03g066928 isoform A [Arachis hypogaea]